MTARAVLWVGVLMISSGCFHRVKLKAPIDDASSEMWDRLEPVAVKSRALVLMRGPATPERVAAVDLEALVLRNDTPVEDPRDLIPLVLPDSQTARLAAQWGAGYERWAGFQIAAGSSLATGLSLLLVVLVTSAARAPLPGELAAGFLYSSLPMIAVVPPLCALIGALWVGKIEQLRFDAFYAYPADLAARRALAAPAPDPAPTSTP